MARHFYIAEPYPDELIGSVLIRTARHRGIGNKKLTSLLMNSSQTKIPLLLSLHLNTLAEAMCLTPLNLLHAHTPFRFITAFMTNEFTEYLARQLTSGSYGSLSVLCQSVTFGRLRPRYCPSCVQEDLRIFGESYWHRKHNLPFVDVCCLHDLPLLQVPKTINSFAVSRPPDESEAIPVEKNFQSEVSEWLAHQSISKLETTFRQRVEDWSSAYREIAIQRNFPVSSTGLCSKSFCAGLVEFYGAGFFALHNCSFNIERVSWPSLMLQQSNRTEMVTAKHLILQGYLLFGSNPNKEHTLKPGRKPRDYLLLDKNISRKLEKRMAKEPVFGRPSAQKLMAELGVWGVYRHARVQLKTTKALVNSWYQAFLNLGKDK